MGTHGSVRLCPSQGVGELGVGCSRRSLHCEALTYPHSGVVGTAANSAPSTPHTCFSAASSAGGMGFEQLVQCGPGRCGCRAAVLAVLWPRGGNVYTVRGCPSLSPHSTCPARCGVAQSLWSPAAEPVALARLQVPLAAHGSGSRLWVASPWCRSRVCSQLTPLPLRTQLQPAGPEEVACGGSSPSPPRAGVLG